MNRIILAYSQANADLALQIDHPLSRIGIPFEHLSSSTGNLPEAMLAAGEPVLLLVTDNFLKDRACMQGLIDVLRRFPADTVLLPVISDGKDENGQPVTTHIDRMVNMLHYMNHWQNEWLNKSTIHQASPAEDKAALEKDLDLVRAIANQTSDIITALREREAVALEALQAHDFELFFRKFGLHDWHGQYRRLVAQSAEEHREVEPALLPETPISSGLLTPEPVDELLPIDEIILHSPKPEAPTTEVDETIAPAAPETEVVVLEESPLITDQIELTLRDAQLWMERGHEARGLELLKIAAEEYPDDARVIAAYRKASANQPPSTEMELKQEAPTVKVDATAPAPENDVNSYDLMGDMAFEKGDYLFAKYCWDRVVEVDASFPGIYRKLGLMAAEHLLDYRETAIHYLQKALEVNAQDQEVSSALAGLMGESGQAPPVVQPPVVPSMSIPVSTEVEKPMAQTGSFTTPGIVLITGATSGIGRATAEIFAKNGYRLILTGRRVERLVELKNHFEAAYHTESLLLPFDVRDAGAVQAALDNLPESFQHIDILVNNAGLAKGLSPIQEGVLDHWETMIDTNVKGLLYVTRVVSPGMVARKRGHIINVCSSAGKEVYPNGNVYCATKFAVDALTRAIRLDLHAHNIRVGQVSPGHVEETEFAITRFDGDADRAKIYNDFQPLKSSDVAEAIYFMATRPAHVNIQDIQMFGTQQASSTVINRSGR